MPKLFDNFLGSIEHNFIEVLNKFAEAVKNKQYEKIDYKIWRQLLRETGCEISSTIYGKLQEKNDYDITLTGCHGIYSFLTSDNSFGKFLFDNIIEMDCCCTYNTNDLIDWLNIVTTTTTTAIGTHYFTYDNQPIKKEKEKKDMNLIKGFDFGSCENDNIKVSLYGVAVKNATGAWVSYDKESNSIIDVDILNFDAKYLYKMPVAIKDVAIGDCIIHNKVPVYVTEIRDKNIVAIDPRAGEEKTILLTRSVFGFDFVTKIINLFDNFMNAATADAPFGNLLPLMMLSEGNDDMLPLMMMTNPQMNTDMTNPLLLYLMTKDGNTSNILPYFYLMSQKK